MASGTDEPSDWQRYAITHYADERVELARREVVRVFGGFDRPAGSEPTSRDERRALIRQLADQLGGDTR